MNELTRHTISTSRGLMGGFYMTVWQQTARLDPRGIHAEGGPVRIPMALEWCPRCKEFFRIVDALTDEKVTHDKG